MSHPYQSPVANSLSLSPAGTFTGEEEEPILETVNQPLASYEPVENPGKFRHRPPGSTGVAAVRQMSPQLPLSGPRPSPAPMPATEAFELEPPGFQNIISCDLRETKLTKTPIKKKTLKI